MQEVHLLRRLHRDVLFLGFSDGVVPCGWLCGFLVLSSLFLVSVSCFFVCLGAGFHVGFYFAYVSVVPLFVRGRLTQGGRAWRPRRVPAPAERGDVHGREPVRRLSGMRHRFRARRAMRMALLHVRLGRPARWRWALGPWTACVYGQINVYGVTTKSERHKRSYWTRTADGNGIGGRKAPVPYGS